VIGAGLTDPYDPHFTSDTAFDFGQMTSATDQTLSNLPLVNRPDTGLPDYDWFRWTMGQAGQFTTTLTVTAGGPLEMHLFILRGIFPQELSNTLGSVSAPVGLTQTVGVGDILLLEVKGQNVSPGVQTIGVYNVDVNVS
jgi:hypothetical protein